MPDVNRLKEVRTFSMLIKYLRDDLDWPIESNSFEDITFEYEPEELGIEPKYANMIKGIRQLRPFTGNQPWGVFFINFDKKRLPVVMLRRILGALAIKKRASANRATQAAWKCNDLLFISTCGEEKSRSISFGHFQEREGLDLPALRVVGWDKDSTQLRLEDAQATLTERLHFPDDPSDLEDWRETWSSAFKLRPREVISTSKALAERLAEIAVTIRQSVSDILEVETEEGPMSQLLDSFRENLIHDLDEDGFADTYAQTLTYGLLTEKMIARLEGTSGTLSSIKLTNPFLSELLDQCRQVGREQQQIDFDELGVGELEELLDDPDTRLDEVLKDFGRTATGEDPVLHFYELFLSEYDPEERKQRGVFYTPRPVVSYIVRSVHELLQTEFGLEDGLADTTTWGEMAKRNKDLEIPDGMKPKDPFVQILDPATGTATFLVETIGVIYQAMTERWKAEGNMELEYQALWNEYVPKHLLPRLHGYELMMAPYAIAHMKIGIKLNETGYRFKAKERARIYLTNALEPPSDIQAELEVVSPALAHEAKAVNEIKRHKKFTVVIGNPPYSVSSSNRGEWIRRLIADYKVDLGEKKLNLDDDYIKFIRCGEELVRTPSTGILALITNSSFLDGITHRQMRKQLSNSFDCIRVLDLHGSSVKKEVTPEGTPDENVFSIKQGVSIGIFVKKVADTADAVTQIFHADQYGLQREKYESLLTTSAATVVWQQLDCCDPYFFFVPRTLDKDAGYEDWLSTHELFSEINTGVQTKRDALVVQFDKKSIEHVLNDFLTLDADKLRTKYSIRPDGRDWTIEWAKTDVRENSPKVIEIDYRPFDCRFTIYTGKSKGIIAYPRDSIHKHILDHDNVCLALKRQSKFKFTYAFVHKRVAESCLFESAYANNSVCPLYLYNSDSVQLQLHEQKRKPNFKPAVIHRIAKRLGLPFVEEKGESKESFAPLDLLDYIYCILHSPTYRESYEANLKIDFPRVPYPADAEFFWKLSGLGGELRQLHLLESLSVAESIASYPRGGSNIVTRKIVKGDWDLFDEAADVGRIWINDAQFFDCIPAKAWELTIGGYQPAQRWLKERGPKKGRRAYALTDEDIEHYQKIVVALSETIRIMAEIDEVIDQHGGWPNAFKTKED